MRRTETPHAYFTSPRVPGEVGLLPAMRSIVRRNPGEGDSPRVLFASDFVEKSGGERKESGRATMSRIAIASIATLLMAGHASAAEPITLRDMGSFHVGGRLVEISGKPVKEVVFTPGGGGGTI